MDRKRFDISVFSKYLSNSESTDDLKKYLGEFGLPLSVQHSLAVASVVDPSAVSEFFEACAFAYALPTKTTESSKYAAAMERAMRAGLSLLEKVEAEILEEFPGGLDALREAVYQTMGMFEANYS